MKKKTISLIFIIILFFAIGLRIYSPLADLPSDISISGSIYTDEGNQCHNSRSKALYKKWYEDDWQITRYNPILPYFKYMIFKVFGVGFLQVRAVSIFFSILTLILSFLIFKSYFSTFLSILGTALIGSNFFILMYGKIGTFETPMMFWMILSLFFIEKFRKKNKSSYLFFAGMSAFMSFVFKNISAYFVPIPFIAYFLFVFFHDNKATLFTRKNVKNVFLIILGILSVFVLWYTLFYLPNKEWIMSAPGKYIGNQVIPKTISQAIGNFFAFNWKEQFFKIPVIWLFSIMYIPVFYRKLILKKSDITDIGFSAFFFAHTAFFMFMNHRPTRYLLPVIFAMIFMLIQYLRYILEEKQSISKELLVLHRIFFFILDTIWVVIGIYFCISPLLFKYFSIKKIDSISPILIIFALLISFLINFILPRIKYKFKDNISLKTKYAIVLVIFSLSLFFNFYHIHKWDNNKTYVIRDINKDFKKNFDNAFIAGLTAPVSVLESKNRALFLFPKFVNWNNDGTKQDTFNQYPITHALLASFNHEISMYFSAWPKKMEHAKLLNNYNVKDQFLHLYSFQYPYIEKITRIDKNNFDLIIKNPNHNKTQVYINKIFIKKDNPKNKLISFDIIIRTGNELTALKKGSLNNHGKTVLKIFLDDESINISRLVVFNIETSIMRNKLRYEGEKFPGRTGIVKKTENCSARYVKFFNGKKHKRGFLIHGPTIPFEYTQGLVRAEFCVSFKNIRNKISPVCTMDIFDYNNQEKFTEKIIIPKKDKTKNGVFKKYSLYAYIPSTKKIEFRLKTTDNKSRNKTTNISIDYVDITYYQGKAFFFNTHVEPHI